LKCAVPNDSVLGVILVKMCIFGMPLIQTETPTFAEWNRVRKFPLQLPDIHVHEVQNCSREGVKLH
jgi:hypothetical protein